MKRLLLECLGHSYGVSCKNTIYKSTGYRDIIEAKNSVMKNVTKFVTNEVGEEMFDSVTEGKLKDMMKFSAERLVEDMEYMQKHIGFEYEPDKYNTYCFFSVGFINSDEMRDAFPVMAHEYIANLGKERLAKFTEIYYGFNRYNDSSILKYYQSRVMSIMVAGLIADDYYTKKTLIEFYKKYNPDEYRKLRNLKTLTVDSAVNIFSTTYSSSTLARVLCMSEAMNIPIDKKCKPFYVILDKMSADYQLFVPMDEASEISDESYEESWRWLIDLNDSFFVPDRIQNITELGKYKYLKMAKELLSHTFSENGFSADYGNVLGLDEEDFLVDIAIVRSILKDKYPKREISFELLQVYAVLYALTNNVAWEIEESSIFFDNLIGIKNENDEEFDFKIDVPIKENETISTSSGNSKPEENNTSSKIAITKEMVASNEEVEKLQQEIDKLRLKIHSLEQKNVDLNISNNSLRARNNENKARESQYNSEHDELVALRNYVYNLTQDDLADKNDDIDAMKDSIKDKRIVIIGGHPNWVAKVKREFPNWRFLSPDASGSTDGSLLVNTEYIYFFTDCIKHTAYYKYINVIRKEKLSFGYIHDINIEANIKQVYKDISNKM